MTRIAIAVLATLAAVLLAFSWHQWDRGRAYREGQTSERLVWQERQARAEIAAEAARRKAEAKISEIERDYWRKQAETERLERDRLAAIEETLSEEAKSNEKNDHACPDDFISRRLRDQLDAAGR